VVHRIGTDADFKLVLASGENELVEFKSGVPRPEILARHLAAFSNTSGGTVLFGIREDGTVTGADAVRVQQALEKAQVNLSSTPSTAVYEIPYQGKTVIAVDVEPSASGPVLSQGAALMRVGSSIGPITRERVVSSLPITEASAAGLPEKVGQLAETISRQSSAIEDLRRELVEANSLHRKLPDWIVGGIIGALIGAMISALISAIVRSD
jgi:hypothetical protein